MQAILDSHEALRAKLAEVEADRADIVARRDQVLDDLRQSLEAEIAARKLVEAKLTVAEAEKAKAIAGLGLSPGNENRVTGDLVACVNDRMQAAISWRDLADEFEAALAERTKERDEARAFAELEWRSALDELHVSNWVGVIDGLSPREAVRKLLELALDQDRDRLTKERDEAIREAAIAGIDAGSWRRCADRRESERLEAESALARVREVPDRWMREQAEYPVDSDNRATAAAAAVRLCAKELRTALTPVAPDLDELDPTIDPSPPGTPVTIPLRLSLSEIEARLTHETMWAAEDAYDDAARTTKNGESMGDHTNRLHRAWLDVILAALGKEQS
jgi:hypothetical protein